MSDGTRSIDDVATRRDPLPVDEYVAEIDRLIVAHDYLAQDQVTHAIGAGIAPRAVVQRVALEHYCLGKWIAPELAVLIANAPDAYSFTMEHATHYRHWARYFVGRAGYLQDPHAVRTQVDWCRRLGLSDDDIRAYTPLSESIAMACTMLFYVRRSYEEGIALVGYVGERVDAARHARTLYEGLAAHYGLEAGSIPHAQNDHEGRASDLFRLVATTRTVQERCHDAVRNFLLTAECRVRAMNRWLE